LSGFTSFSKSLSKSKVDVYLQDRKAPGPKKKYKKNDRLSTSPRKKQQLFFFISFGKLL